MDSGRVSMSQEWSRLVSAEVKEECMTLQGRIQDNSRYPNPLLTTHISKHKDCKKASELDTNASPACLLLLLVFISQFCPKANLIKYKILVLWLDIVELQV